jgi:hypothetical protein
MPEGYWVTQVFDTVDLTNDSYNDIIIRWRKRKFSEGDTVYITIFTQQNHSTSGQLLTFNNLYTPIFTDYTSEYKTGNAKLDSLYQRFVYSNYDLVAFKKNTIVVGFFTDAGGGIDLHFTYRETLRDWALERKVYWDQVNKVIGKEVTGERRASEQISLRDFNILDFLD